MQSDNDYSASMTDRNSIATEDQQEKTLEWLLDQDYSEPSEKLFTISEEVHAEVELSAYEAAIANRPMFGGTGSADDLGGFLDEEIVMTAVGGPGADIFDAVSAPVVETHITPAKSTMAIDRYQSDDRQLDDVTESLSLESDILGLAEEDDMGEHFLVLQKAQETRAEVDTEIVAPIAEPVEKQAETVVTAVECAGDDAGVHEDGEGAAITEAGLTAEEIIDSRPTNSANPYAVIDYVAANEPPADEEAFDQYLLRGEHLVSGKTGVEDLVVDGTEGIVSVDPQIDSAIDYHEDFSAKDDFSREAVVAIAAVIPELMEEITASVTARLADLSAGRDSVQIDVMLGSDLQSIRECLAEDYLPILKITGDTPAALSSLSQGEIDAIYIRLSNSADGSICNKLFCEESMAPNALDLEIINISEPLAGGIEQDHEASGFGEDIFSADITEELVGSTDLAADDFEFSCEDIDFEEDVLAVSSGDTPDSVFDEEVFSVGFDEETVDGIEFDSPENIAETLPEAEEDTTVRAVFEEDIFSSDLVEDFGAAVETSAVDVEAMINALADIETDTDEICGVAVDEFATSDLGTFESTEQETVEPEEVSEPALETEQGDLSWCIPAQIKFSYTSQSVAEVFTDFLDAFIEEGASELEKLEDAMAEWEKDVRSDAAFEPIPRVLHTLKGIAKGIGLQRYGTLIHNFETLLESLERPANSQERSYFCIVNAWLEAAIRGFEHIEAERTDVLSELPTQLKAPVEELKAAETDTAKKASSAAVSPVGQQAPVADRRKEQQLADEGAKTLAAQQTIRMTPEALDHLLSLTNEAQQLGVRSSQSTVRSKHAAAELLSRLSSVRAHVSKIADRAIFNVTAKGGQASSEMDALEMDQYSELQEAANILREGVEDLDDLIHLSSRQNTIAEALLKQQASTISTLGASIQAARVVPVSRLMPGLRRIVRNVSADLGKSVTFRVLNEIGSLDRDNHARCQIVLEHMIRNALDHGIESPGVRVAAGKEANGLITIDASKRGSDYIITLKDDGKGIDPEFMRDVAYERGLDIDVDMLSDEEAIRLIFHKGFSTASSLSEISGRGVGMDIVLSELQHIGGDIEIESKVGEGTTFRVRIPSNITVNGALLVAAGEASYAIPLDGLIAVEHVSVDDFCDALEKGTRLSLFGMDCTPAYLATICQGDSLPERSAWGTTVPVIIAGNENRYMAIAIDDVTQALELVIRSLGAQFSMIPGLAGGATTADGQSIVALDLNALVATLPTDESVPVSLRRESEERMLVLVVDDSRTQRMVATSQFDNLGVETITAENGLVAIDLLNSTHRLPDVILLDIEMPVKDGIQTLREIRKSKRYSDIPVIMVTSRTGVKHRTLAEEAGCNGYMGKPFNFPKLVEQIANLTNHKFQLS